MGTGVMVGAGIFALTGQVAELADAPDNAKLTERDAVLDALGRLDIPIVFDLEIGRVPPHLPLVNGALATVTVTRDLRQVVQQFT